MRYKIVESVNKKENINHPVDDNFTLSEELLDIKSEKINESVETKKPIEEDYNYSEYDKKLLVNRAKSIAKAIYDLYNSDQVEAQGELPSTKEIAEDLLKEPKKIDMYAKFLSKIAGTKKVKNYTEKLIQELASFKKKLSLMKPQTSECLMKVRDIKEGKEIDREVFASLEKLNDGGYSILNDKYFVARVSADDDDDAKAIFKKFLNTDWKKAWKDGTLPKYANDWIDENVDESLKESTDMRSEYVMDDSQMPEWKQICKAFAKKVGAKLVFVNETSCGLEYPDGSMQHVYIDEMMDYLGGMNESVIPAYTTGGYGSSTEKNSHRDFFMPETEKMSDEELKEYLEKLIKEVNKKRAELKNESLSRRQLKHRKNKSESFKRVPKRSINESEISKKKEQN